jgi:hypothetical protein
MTIKIGEKVSINPLLFSHFPLSVPLLRQIPMIDIIKLISIKGGTRKTSMNIPSCPAFMPKYIPIVIIKAIDAEMIEITPRTIEAIVLGECLFAGIGWRLFI